MENLENVVKVNSETNTGPISADLLHVRNPIAVTPTESYYKVK